MALSYKLYKWNHFVYFCFLAELYSTTKDPRPQMIPRLQLIPKIIERK